MREASLNLFGTTLDIYDIEFLKKLDEQNNAKKIIENTFDVPLNASFLKKLSNIKAYLEDVANSIHIDEIVKILMCAHPLKRKMILFNVMNESENYSNSFASFFSEFTNKVDEDIQIIEDIDCGFFSCRVKKDGINLLRNKDTLRNDDSNSIDDGMDMGKVLKEHYPNFYSGRFF
tara:strand:- start:65 stop:589 length:525 start_codon:yes stop_codon:yes gene_type:complete